MAATFKEGPGLSFHTESNLRKRERFRTGLGLVLIVLILAGTGLLFYANKKLNAGTQITVDKKELENLKEQVGSLNAQLEELNKKLAETPKTETTTETLKKEVKGKVAGAETPSPSSGQASAPSGSTEKLGKININTASQAQLESLPGIGPAYASRIIEYRQSHGGFKSIEEIKNVKGIGEKTFEKLRDLITI